jgi:hypothetical protein
MYIAKQQMLYGIETMRNYILRNYIQLHSTTSNYIKHLKQEYCNKRWIKSKQYVATFNLSFLLV